MASTRTDGTTSYLLIGGIVAGPLYLALGFGEALTREAFDLTRHSWSLLANGDLGALQIANFLVSGCLVVGAAAGVRRILKGATGGTWGPALLALFGVGLIASGVFVADPMNGFPPGTPAGPPVNPTLSGFLHILAGAVGFAGFVGTCFVFARRFSALHRRGWMVYSKISAFGSVASGVCFHNNDKIIPAHRAFG